MTSSSTRAHLAGHRRRYGYQYVFRIRCDSVRARPLTMPVRLSLVVILTKKGFPVLPKSTSGPAGIVSNKRFFAAAQNDRGWGRREGTFCTMTERRGQTFQNDRGVGGVAPRQVRGGPQGQLLRSGWRHRAWKRCWMCGW